MDAGRVFVVLAVVFLIASIVLPWVRVDTELLKAKITLQDADRAYQVFREFYIETVCKKKSDIERTLCIMNVPSSSPFQKLIFFIGFMAFFTLLAVLDRVLAVFQGLFILLSSLTLYNRMPELLAGSLAPIVRGFVNPELGFYAFAAAGLLALVGGLLGWSIRPPKSKSSAFGTAMLVGFAVFFSAAITYITVAVLLNLDFNIVLLGALITALIALIADYAYRASKIQKEEKVIY